MGSINSGNQYFHYICTYLLFRSSSRRKQALVAREEGTDEDEGQTSAPSTPKSGGRSRATTKSASSKFIEAVNSNSSPSTSSGKDHLKISSITFAFWSYFLSQMNRPRKLYHCINLLKKSALSEFLSKQYLSIGSEPKWSFHPQPVPKQQPRKWACHQACKTYCQGCGQGRGHPGDEAEG